MIQRGFYGVLGNCSFSKRWVGFRQKKLYVVFFWPHKINPILFWIIKMLSVILQRGLYMYWLKTCLRFDSLSGGLLVVAFVTLVTAFCGSFIKSICVVVVFLLTTIMIKRSCLRPQIEGCYHWSWMFLSIAPTVDLITPSYLSSVDLFFPASLKSTIFWRASI